MYIFFFETVTKNKIRIEKGMSLINFEKVIILQFRNHVKRNFLNFLPENNVLLSCGGWYGELFCFIKPAGKYACVTLCLYIYIYITILYILCIYNLYGIYCSTPTRTHVDRKVLKGISKHKNEWIYHESKICWQRIIWVILCTYSTIKCFQ